jgi:hypothetical protein
MTLPAPIRARSVSNNAACSSVLSLWRKPIVWIGLAALIAAGLVSNWSWLVAAGALPILIGVLPCLAMCALHLCSMGKRKSSPTPLSN